MTDSRWSTASGLVIMFRLVLGFVFLASGLAKIADPVAFLFTLRQFRLLPGMAESFLAVYLPWLEFVLGLCIILGLLIRASALLLAALNAVFIVALGSVIARGIEVDCGCFGLLADMLHIPDMVDWKSIVRNIVFIGMCLYLARADSPVWSFEAYIRNRDHAARA